MQDILAVYRIKMKFSLFFLTFIIISNALLFEPGSKIFWVKEIACIIDYF